MGNNREVARLYSERLGYTVNESTVRGIKKRYLEVVLGTISCFPSSCFFELQFSTSIISSKPSLFHLQGYFQLILSKHLFPFSSFISTFTFYFAFPITLFISTFTFPSSLFPLSGRAQGEDQLSRRFSPSLGW